MLARVATAVEAGLFAVALVVLAPYLLLTIMTSGLWHAAGERWARTERAKAVHFWVGVLFPFVVCVALMVALWFTVARLRDSGRI